jgi:hypothetical protein
MKKLAIIILCVFNILSAIAQVGIGTSTPNSNVNLEISSTTQGILFPRMTSAQRDLISNPAEGLTIFNTTINCIQTNTGTTAVPNWKCFAGHPSSNGTAVVSAYTCSTASAGTLTPSTVVSGVTQTITATVTSVGTYSIATTANGVTFAGSVTFAGTGAQNIVLTATGTPTASGSNTFTLNTTPNCSFTRTTEVYIASVTSTTGRIWMDRNLGGSQVATAFNDALSYGDLYQWGRGADGHQLRTSATTSSLSSNDVPGHGNFITTSGSGDWRSPANTSLWQGVNGINNPCPSGYRIPTSAEWTTEFGTWSPASHLGAINSPLKVPLAGYRSNGNAVPAQGTLGYYWSSTISGSNSTYLFFKTTALNLNTIGRAWGLSVRCIKN